MRRAAWLGWLLLLACDTDPPETLVTGTLRIIPEAASVPAAGGPVFVLIELQPAPERPYAAFLRAHGGELVGLPGLAPCTPAAAANGESAADAGTRVEGALSIFDPSFECPGPGLPCRSGAVLEVPQGDEDVLLVGTLMSVNERCRGVSELGIASARITRVAPGDPEGSGGTGGGGGAGGSGGQGGGMGIDSGVDAATGGSAGAGGNAGGAGSAGAAGSPVDAGDTPDAETEGG